MENSNQKWAEAFKVNSKPNADTTIGKKELWYRQQTANYVQELGDRLNLKQTSKNTAIVYSHRFYTIHSVETIKTKPHELAMAAILLATKTEDEYTKLEHIVRAGMASMKLTKESNAQFIYEQYIKTIVKDERHLLATLGFDLVIDHPHAHVIKSCRMFKVPDDFIKSAYGLATANLLLTSMCLEHSPRKVACVSIYIAMKWSHLEIAKSQDGNDWFHYVSKGTTIEQIKELAGEFLSILEKLPTEHIKLLMRAVVKKETDINVWNMLRKEMAITGKRKADKEIENGRQKQIKTRETANG